MSHIASNRIARENIMCLYAALVSSLTEFVLVKLTSIHTFNNCSIINDLVGLYSLDSVCTYVV